MRNAIQKSIIQQFYGGLDPEVVKDMDQGIKGSSHVPRLTPEIAKYILSRPMHSQSKINRPLEQGHVREYETKMRNKHFAVNGDPIRFDWFGSLQDGQHRLHAVVNTGITLHDQTFRTGLDPKVFSTIDTGMLKKDKDIFAAMGVANSGLISPIIGLHRFWFGFNNSEDWKAIDPKYIALSSKKSVHGSQYLAQLFYENLNSEEKKCLQTAIRITKGYTTNLFSQGNWAGPRCLAFSILKVGITENTMAIQSFFEALTSQHPQNFSDEFPVKSLINTMKKQYNESTTSRFIFTPAMRNELLIRAWNAFATNTKMTKPEMDKANLPHIDPNVCDYTGKVPKIKLIGVVPYTHPRNKRKS